MNKYSIAGIHSASPSSAFVFGIDDNGSVEGLDTAMSARKRVVITSLTPGGTYTPPIFENSRLIGEL